MVSFHLLALTFKRDDNPVRYYHDTGLKYL